MQRHPSIVPLSRVHHFGLLCVWKIKQGLLRRVEPERISKYLQYFFEQHLLPHFKEEEQWLYLQWFHPLSKQAMDEHEQLILLANQIILNTTEELLLKFADALQLHIRFEERTVFPAWEKVQTTAHLKMLETKMQQLHPHALQDDYPDAFWV